MLGQLFTYAASRAAGDAVDSVARRVLWGSVAVLLLLTAFVFLVLVVFWLLQSEYGAVEAATAIAVACAIAAAIAFSIPAIIEWARAPDDADQSAVAQTVDAVQDEARAAVDYFGAFQVVASAFVFGMGAARQLRRR